MSAGVWGEGLLSPRLDQAGCQTWPNLKLGFGEAFFFLLVPIKDLTYYYGRELRGRCVIRGGILMNRKVEGSLLFRIDLKRFSAFLLPTVDSNHSKVL